MSPSLHVQQSLHHCVPGNETEGPHTVHREDGGRLVQFCHRLEGMGDALAPCPSAEGILERCSQPPQFWEIVVPMCVPPTDGTRHSRQSYVYLQMVSSELVMRPERNAGNTFQGLPHERRTQPLRSKSPTCGLTPREGTKFPRSSLTDLEPFLANISWSNWMRSSVANVSDWGHNFSWHRRAPV